MAVSFSSSWSQGAVWPRQDNGLCLAGPCGPTAHPAVLPGPKSTVIARGLVVTHPCHLLAMQWDVWPSASMGPRHPRPGSSLGTSWGSRIESCVSVCAAVPCATSSPRLCRSCVSGRGPEERVWIEPWHVTACLVASPSRRPVHPAQPAAVLTQSWPLGWLCLSPAHVSVSPGEAPFCLALLACSLGVRVRVRACVCACVRRALATERPHGGW